MRYMHKKSKEVAATSSLLPSGAESSEAMRGTVIDSYTPSFDRASAFKSPPLATFSLDIF